MIGHPRAVRGYIGTVPSELPLSFLLKYPTLGGLHPFGQQLTKFVKRSKKRMLEPTVWYRARVDDGAVRTADEFRPPDPHRHRLSAGRFNSAGQLGYYPAQARELAAIEVTGERDTTKRVWIAEVTVQAPLTRIPDLAGVFTGRTCVPTNSPVCPELSTDLVRFLIDKQAALDIQNNDGATALHVAALFGHPESVKLLLGAGAARDLQNNDGLTALDLVSGPWTAETDGLYGFLGMVFQMALDIERIREVRPEVHALLQ